MKKLAFILFLPAAWLFLETGLHAAPQTLSDEEIAALLKQVEIKVIDNREVALVPLREILSIAIERSLTLKASLLGEETALSSVTGTIERNHPVLQTSYGYSKTPSLSSSSTCTGFACGTSTTANAFSASYTQRLDNGMSYGLAYTDTVSQSTILNRLTEGGSISSSTVYDPSAKSSLRGFLSIPFYQNAGTEINSIPVQLAEIGVERSVWSTGSTRLALLRQIALIYWDLVGILESVEVQKKSVALSEKLLRDNQARFKAGLLNKTEVNVTKTQLLRDRQSLFSLRQDALRVEDQVRAALNLASLPVGLYPADKPEMHADDLPQKETLLKKAIEKDSQIGVNRVILKQRRFELAQLENKRETDLDLDLAYTLNGYSKGAFGGAGDFGSSDLHGISATFTWTVPLGDRKTEESIRQKNFQRQQLELQIQERESELDVTIQSLLRTSDVLVQELETAQMVSRLSEEQLENEIKRMQVGKSTSSRVSQFQQEVAKSRQQEIMIRVRFEKNFLELLVLTGDIDNYYQLGDD